MQPSNRTPRPVTRAASTFPKAEAANPSDTRSPFQRAKDIASANLDNQSYYSAEARERLWTENIPLWLHKVNKSDGKFGEKWELEVSENDPGESRGIISLAASNYRDELFGALVTELRSGEPIGPLCLTKVETRNGQSAWDIQEYDGSTLPY